MFKRIFKKEKSEKSDPNAILQHYFDEDYYLSINKDVKAEGLDPFEHYIAHGAKEGRDPNRWFDVNYYLEINPNVKLDENNNPFLHYLTFGWKEGNVPNRYTPLDFYDTVTSLDEIDRYFTEAKIIELKKKQSQNTLEEDILENNTFDTKITKPKKVVAVLGIPRSGLTLFTAILGAHSQTDAWFLPYSTRKDLGIVPFTDYHSIESQYKEIFPDSENIKGTIVISESTSNIKNIKFIMESFKNLSENGVETQVIWLVRDVNHSYLSHNEASHKYWGDESTPLTEESYLNYIKFAKDGYNQILQLLAHQDNMIISYNNIISQPEIVIPKVMNYIDLISEKNQLNFECFSDLNIAGDPGFSEYSNIDENRESLRAFFWKNNQRLHDVLDDNLGLFVKEFNTFVNGIQADRPYNLHNYQKDLLDVCFDKNYYQKIYSDVMKANLDPLEHYLHQGWKEDRNPNDVFNTKRYKENVHDGSLFNPLIHYCLIGRYDDSFEYFAKHGVLTNLILIDPENYVVTDTLLLEAPYFESPEVSIIIPAYNQEKYTLACVESIINNTRDVTYEIIIMDDMSSEKSAREIAKYMKNVIFHSNEENLGFLRNCNKGATFAKGKYLIFLNNDTNVQPGWLSSLVELIDPSQKDRYGWIHVWYILMGSNKKLVVLSGMMQADGILVA